MWRGRWCLVGGRFRRRFDVEVVARWVVDVGGSRFGQAPDAKGNCCVVMFRAYEPAGVSAEAMLLPFETAVDGDGAGCGIPSVM